MINRAQEVGFLLLLRQISLSAIRALLSIMVTNYIHVYKLTLGLSLKSDSSICTMIPGPPRTMAICSSFVKQTSRSQLYISHAVFSVTSASSAMLPQSFI